MGWISRRAVFATLALAFAVASAGVFSSATMSGQAAAPVPARAAADGPLISLNTIKEACEVNGGVFHSDEYGWYCRLANGDEVYCDYIAAFCGYIDRPEGKPASKKTKATHIAAGEMQMALYTKRSRQVVDAQELAALAPLLRTLAKREGRGLTRGRGKAGIRTVRAACKKVRKLINGREKLLAGVPAGAAADSIPGLLVRLRGDLNAAKDFRERACNLVPSRVGRAAAGAVVPK